MSLQRKIKTQTLEANRLTWNVSVSRNFSYLQYVFKKCDPSWCSILTSERSLPVSGSQILYLVCSRKSQSHTSLSCGLIWLLFGLFDLVIEKKWTFLFFCDYWAPHTMACSLSSFHYCRFTSLCCILEGNWANNHNAWLAFTAVKLFCYNFSLSEKLLSLEYLDISVHFTLNTHDQWVITVCLSDHFLLWVFLLLCLLALIDVEWKIYILP